MMIRPRRQPSTAAGFALVLTLIILSVLAVVAVSYLASMSAERGTANAFANKTRAESAARAGADAAMATLRESFRLFPDSATAWDTTQTKNADGTYNEGTTLYLRAKAQTGATPVVPDPAADHRPPNLTPAPADDRRNFVLPLISGVPNGQARLVSDKASVLPAFPATDSDPKNKDFEKTSTDLNIRRSASDKQGVIGSPAGWTGAAPKPARAAWIFLKDETDPKAPALGRYAFFVEDESFKAPVNLAGKEPKRLDSLAQYKTAGTPRPFAPTDLSLIGSLASLSDPGATANAGNIVTARSLFPAGLFPEPRGAAQATGITAPVADALRYLVSTSSGTLNLSRHGSQRLNLNATVSTVATTATPAIQKQVDQLVATLRFHLPFWGQRFYRRSVATDSATLNRTTEVSGDGNGGNAQIYFYKTAANLRDFIDTDSQPTIILPPLPTTPPSPSYLSGRVAPAQRPTLAFNEPIWAQGKDSVPFLQETVVRFRPVVNSATKQWTLQIDYYLEFWNMTDKDIYAAPQAGKTFSNLSGAFVHVASQQTWLASNGSALVVPGAPPTDPYFGAPYEGKNDYDIDLVNGVFLNGMGGLPMDGSTPNQPLGVVFKAGTATVITTDPNCATYDFKGPPGSVVYTSKTGKSNPATTYYCSSLLPNGKRVYAGSLIVPPATTTTATGIKPTFRDTTQDYGTEITLGNSDGYLDCFQYAIAEGGSPVSTSNNDKINQTGTYNDYGYGGSLFGNGNSPSQLGDPRTNNEQMAFTRFIPGGTFSTTPDQSRYWNGDHTLGYPDGNYVTPDAGNPWPDYFKMPLGTPGVPEKTYPNTDANTAPAVVADSPLTSIGQLGDIFDPARVPAPTGPGGVDGSRGGGRTYKIGQRDDRYHTDPAGNPVPNNTPDHTAASNGWAAWRLTDVFGITDDLRLPGRINLNGVPRDGGAALRTALTGFAFQPTTLAAGDPLLHGDSHDPTASKNLAGQNLNPDTAAADGLGALVTAITTRVAPLPSAATAPRPLFERGELGELGTGVSAIFGTNSASTFVTNTALVPGVDMNKTFDSGREELFRRLVEMTCTRGDTFTVHAVGQSLTPPDGNGRQRVTSTQRLRLTFRLRPKAVSPAGVATDFHPGSLVAADGTVTPADFDPTTATGTTKRFAPPDRYDIEILQVSNSY